MKKILKMSLGELIIENLKRNIMLDHVKYVDKGIEKRDEDYEEYNKIRDKLKKLPIYLRWKYNVDGFELEKK